MNELYGIQAAVGYILHAIFIGGSNHTELSEIDDLISKTIIENDLTSAIFSNADTQYLLIDTLKKYGMEDSRIELIAQITHWLFDSNNVSEAEMYHKSYKYILRSEPL